MPSQKTILCVDDDKMCRHILCEFIGRLGHYTTEEAESGQDCLDFLKLNRVDLVILDYNLGDTDGLTVCREIQSNSLNPEVPVIINSVLDRQDLKNHCGNNNIVKIVQKPYSFDHLQQDIETFVEAS